MDYPLIANQRIYENLPPGSDSHDARILMTVSCHDTENIPKVPHAGETQTLDDGTSVQIMFNGVKVLADAYNGKWMTETIRRLQGHHEPQEERVFYEVLKHISAQKPPTMIELGSFWSYYSLWFQHTFPDAVNLMIEPDQHNLDVGQRNFELNNCRGIFKAASIGKVTLAPRPFFSVEGNQYFSSPEVCVDDLMMEYAIDKLDLLHADVQGAEFEMLLGAQRAIDAGRIRFVFLSTHHHSISGDPIIHQKCRDFLVKNGAHIVSEHLISESFSGDGLVVGSFDRNDADLHVQVSHNTQSGTLFRESEYDLYELQVRYEALLKQQKSSFIDYIVSWLRPPAKQ